MSLSHITQVRKSAAGLSRALVKEALLLGNGLLSSGRLAVADADGGDNSRARPGSLMRLPKSLRHAPKNFKLGLGAAKKALKAAGKGVTPVLQMQALPDPKRS